MKLTDAMAGNAQAPIDAAGEPHPEKDRKFVATIGRAFEIMRAFRPGEGPLGNGELAALTGMPKPTVSRLTHTLTRLGYLSHAGASGKYEPTPSILALGYCVLSNMRVRQLAGDYMEQLAEQSGATVGLGSRDRLNMIYVAMRSRPTLRTVPLEVGSRVTIETSALGRAFLAGISSDEREYFYGHFARAHGAAWAGLKSRIEDAIREIADRGFCLVEGEWPRDTRAVAASLVSPDGQTVLAMDCAAPKFDIGLDAFEKEIGPRLAHLCRGLAPMMGG